jgi:hypothetical protein
MLKNFKGVLARLLLAAAVLCASAAAGLAAPRGPGAKACPLMKRSHACCKRARNRAAESARLAPARLCCVTNTPRPAPAGTTYSVQPAPGAATDPRASSVEVEPAQAAVRARDYAPAFSPVHSPPAYIRHASFLI